MAEAAKRTGTVQSSKAPSAGPADLSNQAVRPLNLHVVSHTHWDREWYLTYQQFRMRLVELVDNVLHTLRTRPAFRYFHLDGQTIALEDYLEIRPDREEEVRRVISEGRLLVGPWYQLMDEFLVSGESILRSLLVGQRIARSFGASMPVGYLADQFGHISQMPQILNGFGIDSAIFFRGLVLPPDSPVEFFWSAPDGSEVLCSLMAWVYNNAERIPSDPLEAAKYVAGITATMAPQCPSGHLLLMNGVDHMDVQEDVGEVIGGLEKDLPDFNIVHSTLPQYIEAVRQSGVAFSRIEGELREDRGDSMMAILAGVLSARLYLKRANNRCEMLLERLAEPLGALAWVHGSYYDRQFFNWAWKRLMWNHPHDSICGCSQDQVHREMMPRFAEVEQIATELASRGVHSLAARMSVPDGSLLIFNTLGFVRTEVVDAVVDFPLGPPTREGLRPTPATEVNSFSLWDDEDQEVIYQLVDVSEERQMATSPVKLPFFHWVKRFRIKFVAEEVPSMGYRTYKVNVKQKPRTGDSSLVPWANAMENESLLVEIAPDGTLHLLQKSTERDYEGFNAFEDVGDCGDEYHHIRPVRDEIFCTTRAAAARVAMIESGPISATYRVELDLSLPVGLSPDGRGRSVERANTHVTSFITLSTGSSRLEIRTVIDNGSRNHRLRALFPTGIATDSAFAEGQFDVIGRPAKPPREWGNAASTRPQQSFVDVSDGADGLCILNRGLTEYELLDDQDETLALTLVRSVGELNASGEGVAVAAPEAQCLGINSAEYAIFPHAGDWLDARAWQEGHAFRTPLVCVQKGVAYGGELDTLQRQAWRLGDETGSEPLPTLPTRTSFITIMPDEIVLSALKIAEDRDSLVVRVYNISPEPIKAVLSPGFNVKAAWRINLDEERQQPLAVDEGRITLELRQKEIATLELEIERMND